MSSSVVNVMGDPVGLLHGEDEQNDLQEAAERDLSRSATVAGVHRGRASIVRTKTRSGKSLPIFFMSNSKTGRRNNAGRVSLSRLRSDIHVGSHSTSHGPDHEHLHTDAWEESDFVKPSIQRALAEAASGKFLQGRAKFCSVGNDEFTLAGPAISLYFRFLQQGVCFFFLAGLCTIPTLYLAYSTSDTLDKGNIGQQLLNDPIKVSTFSLGSFNGNNSVIHPFGGEDIDTVAIAYTVVTCDLLVGFLFALWILRLGKDIQIAENGEKEGDRSVSIDDYSVYVTGLPEDAGTREIHDFFNNLYRLDRPSWSFEGYCGCFRCCAKEQIEVHLGDDRGVVMEPSFEESGNKKDPSVTQTTKPVLVFGRAKDNYSTVEDSSFNLHEQHAMGTWIAETAVVRKDGDMLNHFLGLKNLVRKSINVRARIKQLTWKLKSPELAQASKSTEIERHRRMLARARARYEKIDYILDRKVEAFDSKQNIIESRPAVGAFIVFNNEESKLRCIDDYNGSERWFWRYLQPPPLRFRGKHRLTITEAASPGDVVWENMEVGVQSACCRRSLTNLIAFALIAAAAVLARQYVQIKNALFPDDMPTFKECQVWLSGHQAGEDFLLHCIESSNSSTATPTPYSNGDGSLLTEKQCTQCFCMDFTVDQIYSEGIHGIDDVFYHDDCEDFAETYAVGQAFVIVGAIFVVAINSALRVVLRCMSSFERWRFVTSRQSHLAFKLMVVQTLNLGMVNVLVNIRVHKIEEDYPVLLEPLRALGFFNGNFPDTTPEWYASVGTPVCMTMAVNIVLPHVYPLLKFALQRCHRKRAEDCVTQAQLNDLYIGKEFDITMRFASALTNVSVILVYSAGVPLLLLIGFVSFLLTYCIDKWLLLRFYRQPVPCEGDLAHMAYRLMPVLLLTHLAVASWMFGNTNTLASEPVFPEAFYEILGRRVDRTDVGSTHDVYDVPLAQDVGTFVSEAALRMSRTSSLSHAVFGVALVILITVSYIGRSFGYIFNLCCCCHRKTKTTGTAEGKNRASQAHTNPMRHFPPWTSTYCQPLDPYEAYFHRCNNGDNEHFLEKEDMDQGWRVSTFLAKATEPVTQQALVGQKVYLLKKFSEHELDMSTEADKLGKLKKTWEVAAENSLTSYRIDGNPNYVDAMLEMRNSMRRKHSQLIEKSASMQSRN